MEPFVCELLAHHPGRRLDIEEQRVFMAPSLTVAIDQARDWARKEPWIGVPGAMLRLKRRGHPVWTSSLSRPVLV